MKQLLLKAIELSPETRLDYLRENDVELIHLIEAIGNPDSQLRDELVFRIFVEALFSHSISTELLRELMDKLTSEDYLYYQIGAVNDVSVYKRSFSALWISYLLKYDRQASFMDLNQFNNALIRISTYLGKERDGRGFVDSEGWANAVGHAGEMYLAALQHPNFELKHVPVMLQGIKSSLWNGYVFVDDEELRFADFIRSLHPFEYPEEVLVEWIEQVFDQLDHYLNHTGYTRAYFKAKTNSVHMMQALYFKCKFANIYPKVMSIASYFIAKNQSV